MSDAGEIMSNASLFIQRGEIMTRMVNDSFRRQNVELRRSQNGRRERSRPKIGVSLMDVSRQLLPLRRPARK